MHADSLYVALHVTRWAGKRQRSNRSLVGAVVAALLIGTCVLAADKGIEKTPPKMPKFTISQRTTAPLLKAERPYEDSELNATAIIRIKGQWRMWYESYDHTSQGDNDSYLCFATSRDGVHWQRPNLGLVEYGGNKDNNILIDGRKAGGMHAATVFLDKQAPAKERFKMVFARGEVLTSGEREPGRGFGYYIHGATAPDGIHWQLIPEPLFRKNSDTQSVCFRDGNLYRLYVRMWTGGHFKGKREVGYSESPTFGNFPTPVPILAPDAQDPEDLQFYNSAATKLKKHLYVLFPSGFYTGDQTVRPHLAVSRDGKTFERVGRDVVLPLGAPGAFDSKMIFVHPGAIPGDRPHTYWFYYGGYDIGHDGKAKYSGGYGRYLLTVEE